MAKQDKTGVANLAYGIGFDDARIRAAYIVHGRSGELDAKALYDAVYNMAPAGGDLEEVAIDLTHALDLISAEAPATEPRDGPTVGFPPSRDPEQDDGTEVVAEAFQEGVARGLWIAANIAREALAKLEPSE